MTIETWETITGNENLLILATSPGDESRACGGLIAQSCRRGRPPFILVLTDGCRRDAPGSQNQRAAELERRTRIATRQLGMPPGRLLMAGLFAGQVPADGPDFAMVAEGVRMVMWARDCNVVCAPLPAAGLADRSAAYRIAVAVAAASGVGLLAYWLPTADDEPLAGWRLDIAADLAAKRLALATHQMAAEDVVAQEIFVPQRTP